MKKIADKSRKEKSVEETLLDVLARYHWVYGDANFEDATKAAKGICQQALDNSALANMGKFTLSDPTMLFRTAKAGKLQLRYELHPDNFKAYDLLGDAGFTGSGYSLTLNRFVTPRLVYDIDELTGRPGMLSGAIDDALDELLNNVVAGLVAHKRALRDLPEHVSWHTSTLGAPRLYFKREAFQLEVMAYVIAGAAIRCPCVKVLQP